MRGEYVMPDLTPKQKKLAARIVIAALLLIIIKITDIIATDGGARGNFKIFLKILYLAPYFIAGWDVLYKSIRHIKNGQIFDENFLMSLATIGALAIGEYAESVFVMLFYQTGELFQDYAVGRSRRSVAELMDIRPDIAHIEISGDGERTARNWEDMDPEDAEAGMIMLVNPGERVPLDGIVLDGVSSLDTSALTGESLPRDVKPGDEIISGCVNGAGLLRVQVTKSGMESTVSRILELVENAGEKKAVQERFITRFARYYTPCVVIFAALLAIVPPLIGAINPALEIGNWSNWFHRALVFLVVSCPCALVISVPLSFFGGIGAASRKGILIKGSVYLESLARAEIIAFDKTGTLTEGGFQVREIVPANGFEKSEILKAAALAESRSSHPIARSLCAEYQNQSAYQNPDARDRISGEKNKTPDAYQNQTASGDDINNNIINNNIISDVEELAGYGVRARVNGQEICAGNRRLLERQNININILSGAGENGGPAVYIAIGGVYAGMVILSDQLKSGAKQAMDDLKRHGAARIVLLTGDTEAAAKAAADALGIREYHAGLLPAAKVDFIEELLRQKRRGNVCFVGDGINDAPVLARADVGIAMGALGSDAAVEAADIVLMDDNPAKIALAMEIARKTLKIVRQNIIFALTVKFLVLILGAFGLANLWLAVFADVGVAFLAILNAMRCLRV